MAEGITILTEKQENGDWIQTTKDGQERYSPDRIGEMIKAYTDLVTANTESTENSQANT